MSTAGGGSIHVVYTTNTLGFEEGSVAGFTDRERAVREARARVRRGARGAVLVKDGSIIEGFGEVPKRWSKFA